MSLTEDKIQKETLLRYKLKRILVQNKERLGADPLLSRALGELELVNKKSPLNGNVEQQQLHLKRVNLKSREGTLSPKIAKRFTKAKKEEDPK